jgi:hypothetical protein
VGTQGTTHVGSDLLRDQIGTYSARFVMKWTYPCIRNVQEGTECVSKYIPLRRQNFSKFSVSTESNLLVSKIQQKGKLD